MSNARRLIESALPVTVRDRVVKNGEHVCPHCQTVIQEKSMYSPDGGRTMLHGPCKGEIKLPPPDAETVAYMKKHWGINLGEDQVPSWSNDKNSRSRRDLFRMPLPTNQAQALRFMRDLKAVGLDYHLDDDPTDIVFDGGIRTFSDEEAAYLSKFVPVLNHLFADAIPPDDAGAINAGAWAAADQAGWLDHVK